MEYGKRIKFARKRAGLTQAELAACCGLATITIQQYEREAREPKIETLGIIAGILDVSLEYLLGIEEIDAHEFAAKVREAFESRNKEAIKELLGASEMEFLSPEEEKECEEARQSKLDKKNNDRKRINRAVFELNDLGLKKAADIIEDLAKISEYQRFNSDE